MNRSVKSDDQLVALLEHTMRNVARLAPEMSFDEARHDNRWMATAAAAVIVVAGAAGAGLVVSNRQDQSPLSPRAEPTEPASPDTSPGSGTLAPSPPGSTLPSALPSTQGTLPDVFPADVPRPDTFELMTKITWDNVPVGWEFFEQGETTDSVERCTQYAASFDQSWTSTAITDEAPSVLYARFLDNAKWRVGIYCTELGGYLVQVMPSTIGTPSTVDTVDPIS